MKKIYINPATDVYKINYSNVIMMSPDAAGEKVDDPTNFDTGNIKPLEPGEDIDDVEYSRDNNRNSVWDNIW